MADSILTDLTELATTPDSTDLLYVVDGGVSKKIQYSNLIPGSLVVAIGDETSDLSVGDDKVRFPMPYNMTVSEVFIVVNTAPTGANAIFDITESGTTILSTLVSIDATETSSLTAATPPVISDSTLTKGNIIGVNVDQIGSTVAGAGAKLVINGSRA